MAKIHTNENLSDMLTKLILVLKLKKKTSNLVGVCSI